MENCNDYIIAHIFNRDCKKEGKFMVCETTASGKAKAPFDGIERLFKLEPHTSQASLERVAAEKLLKLCPGFRIEAVARPTTYNENRMASDLILRKASAGETDGTENLKEYSLFTRIINSLLLRD